VLSPNLQPKVNARLAQMRQQDVVRRIWAADPFVWTGADEDRWLGWLNLPLEERAALPRIIAFAEQLSRDRITDVVLLGMGGSSLAPEGIQSILGVREGRPALHVLDSTDPMQILGLSRRISFGQSLFLVASKSGSTLEVNTLKQYFYSQAVHQLGETEAGRHFVLTNRPGIEIASGGAARALQRDL
jgi:transaldolase/glucose-6-phosphate isomerase